MSRVDWAFFIGLGVGVVIDFAVAWFYGVQVKLADHLRNPPAPPGYASWDDFKKRDRSSPP